MKRNSSVHIKSTSEKLPFRIRLEELEEITLLTTWPSRNAYDAVILDRSVANLTCFL